ncbi:MAG: prenyltransferase [Actinobacteria bacterium]|nr:prenyltransferase [Actinomycetota bacterium]
MSEIGLQAFTIPEVPGILTVEEVFATARSIAELQLPNGMIPWQPGGHCDPWNHVETAMALTVVGMLEEAEAAYQWLVDVQLGDGSWFNYYLAQSIKDQRLDTNVCAYLATGIWHHYLITGDEAHLVKMWPTVARAIDFVVRRQLPDGSIRWSLDAAGRPEAYALLTGSSSIYHALRCAVAIAEHVGELKPDWELASGRLGHAVAHHPHSFEPKEQFAMDWYYPMLSGALEGAPALQRLDDHWERFVMPGLGVRCVSQEDWITAAETAECVMALDALGRRDAAEELLSWTRSHRQADGSYVTGIAYPDRVTFPADERTAYTAAAVILAADALSDASPASGLFRGEGLPAALDLAEPHCPEAFRDACSAGEDSAS